MGAAKEMRKKEDREREREGGGLRGGMDGWMDGASSCVSISRLTGKVDLMGFLFSRESGFQTCKRGCQV